MSRSAVRLLPLVLVVTLSACGGPSEQEQAQARQAAQEARQQAKEVRQKQVDAIAVTLATVRHDACEKTNEALIDELSELGSRLSIGMDYDEYTDRVGDVRVAYDKADYSDSDAADEDCLTNVGIRLEKAFNEYASAQRSWTRCFEAYDCDSNESRMQTRWTTAAGFPETAEDRLEELGEVDAGLRSAAAERLDAADAERKPASQT